MTLENPPKIADLLLQHKAPVELVLGRTREWIDTSLTKEQRAALEETVTVDELFVLRFVLSAKKESYKNVIVTLQWRVENAADLLKVRWRRPPRWPPSIASTRWATWVA